MPAHHLGELTGLLVADVPGRGAHQPGDGVPLLVLAHVQPDHPVLAAEQRLRQRPGQLGLADAGRAEEQEAADGPVRAREPGTGAQHRLGHHGDRLLLAHHPLVQVLFQTEQPLLLLLGQPADRDAGLPGHHLGDGLRRHLQVQALVGLVAAGHLGDPLLQLTDPVAKLLRLLVVLVRDRLVLVPDQLLDLALHRAHVRALRPGTEPDPRARLVDQVDRLVRQPPVGEVPVRQLHGGDQRLVGVADLVVGLVPVPQPAQDLDRVLGRRLRHQDRLEAAGQRRVLLDPAELLQRGRAHDVQLAPGQRGLEDVPGVQRAALAAGARAHDGVQLVDEHDQPVGLGADLLHDVVEALLEVAPVAGAGHHPGEVQGDHPAPRQDVRDLPVRDPLGQALHDRRLADARVTDQHRVVLATP